MPDNIKEIKVKHFLGEQPGPQVTDWWKEKDWEAFYERVEKHKKDGTYGKEVESTLILKHHPILDKSEGLILDLENIEKHTFKPLNVKPNTDWISVKDRLPNYEKEEEQIFIVSGIDNGRYVYWAQAYAYGKDDNVFTVPGWSKMNVTHWMPLPEPPKE